MNNLTKPELTGNALQLFENAMFALDDADEIGGVESTAEYIDLMDAVIAECAERKYNASRTLSND